MRYEYKGSWYTPNELSEMSSIKPPAIRQRLRQGYSVEQAIAEVPIHDSVKEFAESSWWEDWVGMPISYLHKTYWEWCVSHRHTPLTIRQFSRQLLSIYPFLKTIPTTRNDRYERVIRKRS